MKFIPKKFTLIEILIVIGIILVLVAMLSPIFVTSIQNAKKTKAKAEMNAIVTAIKSYSSTYGVYPIPSGWSNANTNEKYSDLISLLTNFPAPETDSAYQSGNSRQIRFLDVPNDYSTNNFKDPWGNYFYIFLDTDYDGQVDITGADASHDGTKYGDVFIYSTGNSTNPSNYVYSW